MSTFDTWILTIICIGLPGLILKAYLTHRRRMAYIATYAWPPGLIDRLKRQHPEFTPADITRIDAGLRQFFRAYLNGGKRSVAMPSKATDALWHEFILYTKSYDAFCQRAFGRFLHHTPAAVLRHGQKQTNEGLRRVWWQCCKEEKIDPYKPAALPLLFALDADLKIQNGYHYTPDCRSGRAQGTEVTIGISFGSGQCASDFSDSSIDGGTDGLGDGAGGGSDGDGGGCGGD